MADEALNFPNLIIAGVPFTFAMEATNNPTSWAAATLPAGVTLDTVAGVIAGTIAAPGVYAFQLTASNAGGVSAPMFVYLEVSPAWVGGSSPSGAPVIMISPSYPYGAAGDAGCIVLAPVAAGSAINNQFYATNEPTSWAAHNLPAGLALNAGTGILSGTIATPGNYLFEITATNASGTSTPAPVAIVVSPAAVTVSSGPITTLPWLSDLSLIDLQFDLRLRGVQSTYAQNGAITLMQSDGCKLAVALLTPAQVSDAVTLWLVAKTVEDSVPVIDVTVAGSAALTAESGGSYYLLQPNLGSDLVTQAFDDMNAPAGGGPRVLILTAQLAVQRGAQIARSQPFTINIIERVAQAGAPSDIP